MLSIKSLVIKDYQHDLVLVDHLSFTLNENDKIAIIENEGSGKSTLLNVIKGETLNYIHVEGEINRPGVISYLDQNIKNKWKDYKVSDYLSLNLETLGLKKNEMLYQIKYLSEGTKFKILLILMTSNDYDILLLDEPTRNISPMNQDELYNLFLSFEGAIVAVTHDRSFIEAVFDDIYELTTKGLNKIELTDNLS